MDGAKAQYRYFDGTQKGVRVSRRGSCTEGFARARLERGPTRILVIVGCDFSENEKCRKSKVSLAIYVSQGLVST
jgi:hypothetical protein